MEAVLANCKAKTGRTVPQWVALARKARTEDRRAARAWAKEQGLRVVYQSAVVEALLPSKAGDDEMIDAQYSGTKASLRPIYEALVRAARTFGKDVEVMPRKSQVTLSRTTSFAVIRAATRDRVDVALKLHGEMPTARPVFDAKAMKSDPSHVVGVRSVSDVDKELVGWLRKAYDLAGEGGEELTASDAFTGLRRWSRLPVCKRGTSGILQLGVRPAACLLHVYSVTGFLRTFCEGSRRVAEESCPCAGAKSRPPLLQS
jgi:hypothetical protein